MGGRPRRALRPLARAGPRHPRLLRRFCRTRVPSCAGLLRTRKRNFSTASKGALASVVWEETVTWDVPGPVVLLDSACPGGEVHEDERLRVERAAGRYRVQAAEVTPGPRTTLCLVQFVPVT
ncbi:Imm21 family immunity protein [Streptomyces mirabilis]|uniref:Imm21 family immunity protein n=1 Tax=Streptomyces mirabilis TaxID=68239 RepID=UPI0009A12118